MVAVCLFTRVHQSRGMPPVSGYAWVRTSHTFHRTFQAVQARGSGAVAAIQNFEQVVSQLDSAVQMAVQANTTVQEAERTLATITILNLEASANQSRNDSTALLASVNALNYNPQGEAVCWLNSLVVQQSVKDDHWNDYNFKCVIKIRPTSFEMLPVKQHGDGLLSVIEIACTMQLKANDRFDFWKE